MNAGAFIDSGAFIAYLVRADRLHAEVVSDDGLQVLRRERLLCGCLFRRCAGLAMAYNPLAGVGPAALVPRLGLGIVLILGVVKALQTL